jgi:hypothetical protein
MGAFPEPVGVLGGFNPSEIGPLAAIIGMAQLTIEGEFMRATFDWDGNTGITCNASELEEGKELDIADGGWKLRKKCKVSTLVRNFPDESSLPKANDTITVYLSEGATGIKLRILKTKNSYNKSLLMECVDTNHP